MKAYIHNNQVKVGTEKPVIDVNNAHAWHRVMFEWESGLMIVENAMLDACDGYEICVYLDDKAVFIKDGQEVNYNKETKQITKIQ